MVNDNEQRWTRGRVGVFSTGAERNGEGWGLSVKESRDSVKSKSEREGQSLAEVKTVKCQTYQREIFTGTFTYYAHLQIIKQSAESWPVYPPFFWT